MINILYLIRVLDHGGAERQLIELARGLDKTRFAVTVATMYDGGGLHSELEGVVGVRLVSLHKRGRWDIIPFGWRAVRLVQQLRPTILHGSMSVANELALLLGRVVDARVVWGLRVSDLDLSHYDWLAATLFRLSAILSARADLIIANSHAGSYYHQSRGYVREHMVVIPNGIDTQRFQPDEGVGRIQRRAWGIADDTALIGIVGRLDPHKDHPTFLRAAALLSATLPQARFVCVGSGPAAYLHTLQRLSAELGIAERVIWAGGSDTMVAVYNALDLLTSTSLSEGWSNVLGEALACGVPCVATDVGDSAWLLGGTGMVVPPGSPQALARAWHSALAPDRATRRALGLYGRERILRCFSTGALVTAHTAYYEQLVSHYPEVVSDKAPRPNQ